MTDMIILSLVIHFADNFKHDKSQNGVNHKGKVLRQLDVYFKYFGNIPEG